MDQFIHSDEYFGSRDIAIIGVSVAYTIFIDGEYTTRTELVQDLVLGH